MAILSKKQRKRRTVAGRKAIRQRAKTEERKTKANKFYLYNLLKNT